MKTPQELLEEVRELWIAHPDDYDPTDEQMRAFIEHVQRDAVSALTPKQKAINGGMHPSTAEALFSGSEMDLLSSWDE